MMPAPVLSRWSAEQTVAFWLFILKDPRPQTSTLASFLEKEGYNVPSSKQSDHIRQKTLNMKKEPYWRDESWDRAAIEEELETHRMFVPDLDAIKQRFHDHCLEQVHD